MDKHLAKEGFDREQVINFLIRRDGFRCQIYFCKNPSVFTEKNFLTLDHVLPKAAGGTDDLDNLVIAHLECNQKKADRIYLPDGTLPPLAKRQKPLKVKRPEICNVCNGGRSLGRNQRCSICGSEPMPKKFPRYKQRPPKECNHDEHSFCWSCSLGFVSRDIPISSIIESF